MTDITTVGRTASSAARTGWFVWRIFKQRLWYYHLRYQAVASALWMPGDASQPTPPHVNEAALRMCEILDSIAIPMEVDDGFLNKWGRRVREKITRGVRYPLHDGPYCHTYYDRLHSWAETAAKSEAGNAALDYAGFPPGEDRARLFANRVVAKTSGLLLSHDLPDSLNRLREKMATEVHRSTSWREEAATYRRFMTIARATGAGVASTLLFDVGFSQELSNSLTMGGLAAASTAAAEITSGGFGRLTGQMKAARRQVRAWLAGLSLWLVRYVTWADGAMPERRAGDLRGLISIVNAIRANEATLQLPDLDERIEKHLARLIEVASRVGDRDLETALMDLQTALTYDSAQILNSLTALITLINKPSGPSEPDPDGRSPGTPPPDNLPSQRRQRSLPHEPQQG